MFVPDAVKVGTIATTGAFAESLSVIVTVDVATPFAVMVDVPEMEEFAATAEPDWNVTVPPVLVTGVLIESVFTSAVVDARVQVDVPAAVVDEHVP